MERIILLTAKDILAVMHELGAGYKSTRQVRLMAQRFGISKFEDKTEYVFIDVQGESKQAYNFINFLIRSRKKKDIDELTYKQYLGILRKLNLA